MISPASFNHYQEALREWQEDPYDLDAGDNYAEIPWGFLMGDKEKGRPPALSDNS